MNLSPFKGTLGLDSEILLADFVSAVGYCIMLIKLRIGLLRLQLDPRVLR